MSEKKKSQMYTIRQMAKIKGCSRQAVRQMITRRGIRGKRLGILRYFSEREAKLIIESIAVGGQKSGGRKTGATLGNTAIAAAQGSTSAS